MSNGKLIVIDGLPGAGKRTNAKKVVARLTNEGSISKLVSFPNFFSDSSALVKRYLRGHFQNVYNNNKTYVKQMSMFFATDRVATMIKRDGQLPLSNIELLDKGFNIICDRYTTSNILHMSTYFDNEIDIEAYINWVEEMEYDELHLPRPDLVLFLDIPKDLVIKNITKRNYYNKENEERINIHNNPEHIERIFEIKDKIINYCGWKKINCCDENGEMRSLEDVNEEIYNEIMRLINW